METDFTFTVSGNNLPEPQEQPIEAFVDILSVEVHIDEQNPYTEQIDALGQDVYRLTEQVDELTAFLRTVSENSGGDTIVEVTVSENTVSENTISENAIMTTPLTKYSLTDSLLLIIILLLLLSNAFAFYFMGGSKK